MKCNICVLVDVAMVVLLFLLILKVLLMVLAMLAALTHPLLTWQLNNVFLFIYFSLSIDI